MPRAEAKKIGVGLYRDSDGNIFARFKLTINKVRSKEVATKFPAGRGALAAAKEWIETTKANYRGKHEYVDIHSNGTWYVTLPATPIYPKYVREFGRGYETAQLWAAEQAVLRKTSVWVSPEEAEEGPKTLRDVCDHYLQHGVSDISDNTLLRYKQLLTGHILPYLGDIPIGDIQRKDLVEWGSKLRSSGRSAATIDKAVTVLSIIFNYALGVLSLIETTPVVKKHLKLPKKAKPKARPFGVEKFADILGAVERKSDQVGLALASLTMLRPSEWLPLTVGDVDFVTLTVTVSKHLTRSESGSYVLRPGSKTTSEDRTVNITPWMADEIKKLTAGKNQDDLLFPSPSGLIWNQDNFRNRVWYPALDAVGEPRVKSMSGLQNVRRSAVTAAHNAGLSDKRITAQTGHKEVATLQKHYMLPSPDDATLVAQTYGAELEPAISRALAS